MTRRYMALALLVPAFALSACGGSDESSDSSSEATAAESDQDRGQVRLTECLREQGLDVGEGFGPGSDGGAPPESFDREAFQEALEGPCKEYRDEAFGDVSAADRSEFIDQMTKFTSCMRENGVDVPDFDASGGGEPPDIDQDDPKVQEAIEKCRDQLPQGGPGGEGE